MIRRCSNVVARSPRRLLVVVVAGVLAVLAGALEARAQTGTVTGQVLESQTGTPMNNVQVSVVGLDIGTLTDASGRFRIAGVPAGRVEVRAQSIGFRPVTETVTVTAGEVVRVDFTLAQTALALEGIVVTALGIERAERELTTSVQSLSGEALVQAPEANLVSSLSGKVSGVHILSSNTPGGSARMVIRGVNSLTGNNQPLFVLDGIPVSNAASTAGYRGYNAIDYGNLIQDLNPNDIQSITVLKGPNAAALYGSRAANGAVIITTKKGATAQGLGITARMDVTFESPLRLPEYQNMYGQGTSGNFYTSYDESWGPRMDVGNMIVQPLYGDEPAPFNSHPDNVRDFFELGQNVNTSVSMAAGGEAANVRLSLGRVDHDGMLPGFGQQRTTVALAGGAEFTDRLRAETSLQYLAADTDNRPSQGYGEDNVMWQFLWFGRQVDTNILKERRFKEDGSQFNWNTRWNNNPYWTQFEDWNWDGRDRLIGHGSLTYAFTPWLDVMVRAGTDVVSEHRKDVYRGGSKSISSSTGAYRETSISREETNFDFLASAEWPGLEGMTLGGSVGGSRRDNSYTSLGVWIDDLVIPLLYDAGNSAVSPIMSDYREERRVNSLYGTANFGYRDVWFVDVTARNDWSSTLPEDNNSYFYPSISTSLIASDLVDLPALSYAKVRLGWAQVGNDAAAYQLVDPYISDVPFGSVPRFTASNRLRNANLKPEQTESWELGAELRFLEDRLGFDVTYYNSETSNQIVPVDVTPLTGFTTRMMNAGTIANRGIELLVDAVPVELENGFRWETSGTFSRNVNEVVELAEGLETLVLDTYYGVRVEARVGEPYGEMYGRLYVRDSEGNIVVGSNGRPLNSSDNPNGSLGNYNPDWSWGFRNRFEYGPLSAHVLIDGQKGGTVYSMTNRYGQRSGVLIETLEGRKNGRTIEEGGGLIVEGVKVVNGDTVPNDIVVEAQDYWRRLSGITEAHAFDATYVKLREVRVGFRVPTSWTNRIGMAAAEIALVGRNLALWTDVPHIDPETAFNAGNVQGFEYAQLPTARTFGFSVVLTP
jgi:TonB-linked SusC/RagA family outer membrane protein